MRIGLIPLDERPANTRYPAMIAAIADAHLTLPPAGALSQRRSPADCAALGEWLEEIAPELDGLIVSCEMLGYGSLIASRTGDDPAGAALARIHALREVRRRNPRLPIYGFSLITRVSNANDATEEPAYWAEHGERLYALSQLLDRRERGLEADDAVDRLASSVPDEHRRDFLRRRLRNHAVNAAVLHMLADGVFDLLVLSSDDTSPDGLPSRERRWLAGWAGMLGLTTDDRPPTTDDQAMDGGQARRAATLLMYPGADEVGCVLLARLLNERAGAVPRFAPTYAPPEAASHVAAYEDGPVRTTLERQVRAVGGRVAADGDAIWVGVNAPVERRGEWEPDRAAAEREGRLPALRSLAAEAREVMGRGQPAAIADVAYPNGADPALLDLLLAEANLPALAAYGAWNTAGNTIGAALAQACAAQLIGSAAGQAAHERFLLHRLLEDWGYQRLVRAETRQWLSARYGTSEPQGPEGEAATVARVERQLNALIGRLPGFAGRFLLVPGSVRLPWGRTFEIDFELTTTAKGGG